MVVDINGCTECKRGSYIKFLENKELIYYCKHCGATSKDKTLFEELGEIEEQAMKDVDLDSEKINADREKNKIVLKMDLCIADGISSVMNYRLRTEPIENYKEILGTKYFKEEDVNKLVKSFFDKFDKYSCIKNDKWYLELKEKTLKRGINKYGI